MLAARLNLDVDALYPQMAIRMAFAALNTALERWATTDGRADPLDLTDRAFAMLAPALRP